MMKCLPLTLVLLFAASLQVQAQDFVYKPRNPAFGGDTFNYNWLLSSAQAQDLTVDPRTTGLLSQRSTAQTFANSLNNLLLSQLSRELISSQFGENGLTEGLYRFGNFQVDIATTLEGFSITIFDQSLGESTQIIIPFF